MAVVVNHVVQHRHASSQKTQRAQQASPHPPENLRALVLHAQRSIIPLHHVGAGALYVI